MTMKRLGLAVLLALTIAAVERPGRT